MQNLFWGKVCSIKDFKDFKVFKVIKVARKISLADHRDCAENRFSQIY